MSDKTTAVLAAEQSAEVAETTTTTTEELPAASLEELEQLDVSTITLNERPPFRITDDRCADWAVRKIMEDRAEYERIKALGDEQITAITEKIDAAKRRFENGTAFLTNCLSDYFRLVPHKATKTTEKYRLLSGTLVLKKGGTKTTTDDEKLVPWLRANGYDDLIKVEESAKWGELKKKLTFTGTVATIAETGEIVEGVTVGEAPDTFKVEA